MHPNAFLQTYWRMDLRPQVFVAMSFADEYKARFDKVIAPAVKSIQVNGVSLTPYRVDLSKTGDSILTDIMDGIAHSQLVLADVSTMGKDSKTGYEYRNGNVMYELGLALACRHPSEVLLVRDDHDRFLFDVSTIPHRTIDFTDEGSARQIVLEELLARLREGKHVHDARVRLAIAGLTGQEIALLKDWADLPPDRVRGWSAILSVNDALRAWPLTRLLEKQVICLVGEFEEQGYPGYVLTPLGKIVAKVVKTGLRRFPGELPSKPEQEEEREEEPSE